MALKSLLQFLQYKLVDKGFDMIFEQMKFYIYESLHFCIHMFNFTNNLPLRENLSGAFHHHLHSKHHSTPYKAKAPVLTFYL